jgi:hypothetical protein
VAGLEPAKPLGRLFEGQPALPFAYTPKCELFGRDDPTRTGMCPNEGSAGLEPAALPLCYAPANARGETRTLNQRGLSPPPLPAWATRARDARGGSRTRTETLFERATSAVWVTRARLRTDTGGGSRTLKSRLLTTVCQPFALLPRAMLEEGIEPSTGI